jgi:hypothetical protein
MKSDGAERSNGKSRRYKSVNHAEYDALHVSTAANMQNVAWNWLRKRRRLRWLLFVWVHHKENILFADGQAWCIVHNKVWK